MREIQFGQDGSFSYEAMVERHNADLANGLGNLASRVLAMLASQFDGVVPAFTTEGAGSDLPEVTAEAAARYQTYMQNVELSPALATAWEIVARANHYLVEKEPWKIKDESRRDELASILYASAETLRILAVLTYPIMPRAASVLWSQLGIEEEIEQQRLPEAAEWGKLAAGTKTSKGESLFPRLETE
jgi:methionyl-tRNA synthetase